MSTLRASEKSKLEKLFEMSGGYVLSFSDAEFGTFFGDFDVDIHSKKYQNLGTSKAKKIREFWRIEDDHTVGKAILEMIKFRESIENEEGNKELLSQCNKIGNRLLLGKVHTTALKSQVDKLDSVYIKGQIKRMEDSIESDPDLAIGTAKELIESCCKTILNELKVEYKGKSVDMIKLTKLTMDQLNLLPEQVDSKIKGMKAVKKVLGSLSTIAQGMAELRNLYGTGHGKSSKAKGLMPRHARLAVMSSSTLVHFLFETFEKRKKQHEN